MWLVHIWTLIVYEFWMTTTVCDCCYDLRDKSQGQNVNGMQYLHGT